MNLQLINSLKLIKLKYAISLRRSRSTKISDAAEFIGLENIESGTGRLIQNNSNDVVITVENASESLSNGFEIGDVLFCKLRPYLAKSWVAEFSGYCTTELLVMVPLLLESRFLLYICLSSYFVDTVDASTFGSKMPRADWDFIGNIKIPIPIIDQQRAIAYFLDRETSRIDALISAKKKLLELLAEKRKALITRAVTRGLDPEVKLRDSGVPWLGMVPEHWETTKIAWLFRDRDERGEPELPLLEVSINTGVVLREFSDDKIESTAADFNTYKIARKGDIVFNKMRMWQGAVGIAPQDGLVSPDYTVAEPIGDLLSSYAGQLFRIAAFSAECARWSHGITWDRLRIYWDGFREINVAVPPENEQKEILNYLTVETSKIDELKVATENTIELLKERRSALISEAVTGKTRFSF